jgi:hypothetical protein
MRSLTYSPATVERDPQYICSRKEVAEAADVSTSLLDIWREGMVPATAPGMKRNSRGGYYADEAERAAVVGNIRKKIVEPSKLPGLAAQLPQYLANVRFLVTDGSKIWERDQIDPHELATHPQVSVVDVQQVLDRLPRRRPPNFTD